MPHWRRLSIESNTVERIIVRRLFGALLLCSSLVLIAAGAPPAAAPSPKPSLAPSATPPAAAPPPSVLIYPFDVQTGVDAKIGGAIAQILAQEMTAAGGITVLPVPIGITRPNFLDNARKQHADVYISGYVTPVGDSAAVVEQVVSVDSGVIIYSQTSQVSSVADVLSQSLQARATILAFFGRGTQNIEAQTSGTPAPSSTNGAQMQIRGISGIVDSVFHRKGAPTPSPTPIVKPDRGVIVTPVTAAGAVGATDLTNATNELFFAAKRNYTAQTTGTPVTLPQSADTVCGSNRNNTILGGTLAESFPRHGREQFSFTLSVYTCFGAVLDREIGKGESIKAAVDAAVAAYVTAHPDNS
jgi:hypothetical protein